MRSRSSVSIRLAVTMALATAFLSALAVPAAGSEGPTVSGVSAGFPQSFGEIGGQLDPKTEFLLKGRSSSILFTRDGLVIQLEKAREAGEPPGAKWAARTTGEDGSTRRLVIRLDFEGRSEDVRIEAAHSGSLVYRGVWPGVDAVLKGTEGRIKYEFRVDPGADPGNILLAYEGIEGLRLSDAGDLIIATAFGQMRDERPTVYQEVRGKRVPVGARFKVSGNSTYGFELDSLEKSLPLVIDPSLTYSTYLGGSQDDSLWRVAVDSSGSAYAVGETLSTDFPTNNPYQGSAPGATADEVFVTKLSSTGSSLVYSTYLGGADIDSALGVAVDSSGSAYVAGWTNSTDFPTLSAYQSSAVLSSGFVTKLSPAGSSLVYSTYLGGSAGGSSVSDIAVNSTGNAYVVGVSPETDFPTVSPYQTCDGSTDAFVSKFSATGSSLAYSTCLRGSDFDTGTGIAIDASGNAYVVGTTLSTNFPRKNAYQSTHSADAGGDDAFVTKLAASGSSLDYSTYLGASGNDDVYGIAVDSSGSAYVTGSTDSTNFPTKDPYQATPGDGFVTKFTPAGTALAYSTYFSGLTSSVAVDPAGSAYVAGTVLSTSIATRSSFQRRNLGGIDSFVTKFTPSGSTLAYSTYLGGAGDEGSWPETFIALDSSGNAYVAGVTRSTDFPTRNPYQASYAGGTLTGTGDAFVAKIPGRGIRFGSADYDGDHQDEVGVFRNGMWFMTYSNDYAGLDLNKAFGSPVPGRDAPQIGEFSCVSGGAPDGQADLAVLRGLYSSWQVTLAPDWGATPDLSVTFGTTAHKRIATRRLDTNGDGCSDIGVFRSGCFDVLESPAYATVGTHVCFGPGTDEPLAADLDGDGKGDLILWRAASAHYTYRLSSEIYSTDHGADLGAGDYPLIGDLNADGMADLASYKAAFSTFRTTYSPDFVGVDNVKTHGVSGDIPILADANGDGVSDIGIFRNAIARWWFKCSPDWNTDCVSQSFGVPGDVPIYGRPPGM